MADTNDTGSYVENPEKIETPLPETYWVQPHIFLAGEYPREPGEGTSRWRLRRLVQSGIQVFVNLTQPGEFGLKPYAEMLLEEVESLGLSAECREFPIQDKGIPRPEMMTQILDVVDGAVHARRGIYVHCYAGVGRTGTVVGCYLVRHGMPARQALDRIAVLRQGTRHEWIESPESMVQKAMVMGWASDQ